MQSEAWFLVEMSFISYLLWVMQMQKTVFFIITFIYSIIFLPEVLGFITRRNSGKLRGSTRSETYQFDIFSSAVTARPKYSLWASFSVTWNCCVLKQFICWINLQPVFHIGRYSYLHQSFYAETLLFLFYAFWVMSNDLLCLENVIL